MTTSRSTKNNNFSFLGYPSMRMCQSCFDSPVIATCDRSKPSELVEFKGQMWTKKNPQKMMLFPTAKTQSKLCYWHQYQQEARKGKWKVGKES